METVLVAEIYLLIEKPFVSFAPWLSRLKSEEHGERGEGGSGHLREVAI